MSVQTTASGENATTIQTNDIFVTLTFEFSRTAQNMYLHGYFCH